MRRTEAVCALLGAVIAWGVAGTARADWEMRVRGSDGRVRAVALEVYVARSVAAEVYSSWPMEALKAQAVATRSYALHERSRNAGLAQDVDSSVLSQRYVEAEVPRRVHKASEATRGEYLSFGGQPILAAFHASAGGRTASAHEVWGTDVPYLQSVGSPDDASPDYFWSYEIAPADLGAALRDGGLATEEAARVEILERSASGRVHTLQIGGLQLSGRDLRQVLGGRAIRSARFDVRADGDVVRFLGSGAGHGVGLCQWGTRELALQGKTYREILSHYYPGANFQRVDAAPDVAARSPLP